LRFVSATDTLSGVLMDICQHNGAVRASNSREGGPSAMSDILLRAQVRVQTTLYSLRHRQEGQGLVEYGLIIASIAILLIVAMLFLAGKIDDLFSETGSSVESPGPLP
jgi:pilus assembly protein Flp/PilA